MDKFIVHGGRTLSGRLTVTGAKNAVLPIMAAVLLTDEEVVIRNVPNLRDVRTMSRVLEELGVDVCFEDACLRLKVRDASGATAPYELVSTMRASICVLGPLLAKRGAARVSMPGGCVLGVRPIDMHIKGLNALGAGLQVRNGYVIGENVLLRGGEVFLGSTFGSTVLGTANVMTAAVLAEGRTVIESAAMEPEIQDLGFFLKKMGARISGVGTHRIVIDGVGELHGCEHTVISDRIEAGTFLIAGALAGGTVEVEGANPEHLMALLHYLDEAGVVVEKEGNLLRVHGQERFCPVDITTQPYPGFPTDLQAQMLVLMTLSDGISVVTERIYPDRFIHVAELNRLGAEIRKEGAQAIIHGVGQLSGAQVMASDLRASAALVLAGLVAEGDTEIHRVYHIDRGYEGIDRKLSAIGASIDRV
jgi:UDP-N-acetylglucosamine 1-carboxyvinyltransferase